jgi:hypothetical protein
MYAMHIGDRKPKVGSATVPEGLTHAGFPKGELALRARRYAYLLDALRSGLPLFYFY